MSPKSAPTSWNLYLAYYLVDDLRVALLLVPPKPSSGCTAYRWQINRDSYIPTVWHKHFEKTSDAGDVLGLHFVAQVPTEKHAALYNVLVKDLCVASAYNRRDCEDYGPKVWAVDALDALAKANIITVHSLRETDEPSVRKRVLTRFVDEGCVSCQHRGRRDGNSLLLLICWQPLDDKTPSRPSERSRSPFRAIRNVIRPRRAPGSQCRTQDEFESRRGRLSSV